MNDREEIGRLLAEADIGPVHRIVPWKDHIGSTCRLHRIEAAGRRFVGKIAVGPERHSRAVREIQVLRSFGPRWRTLTPALVASRVEPADVCCILVLERLDPIRRSGALRPADLEAVLQRMSQAWRIGPREVAQAGLKLPCWGRGERGDRPHRRRARRLERRSEVVLRRFPESAERHTPLLDKLIERFEAVAERSHARPNRLIHGDLHAENIVFTEKGPRVLDWQTCSLGDPVHDVVRLALESEPGRSFDSIRTLCERRSETAAEASDVARAVVLVHAGFMVGLAGRPDLAAGTRDHRFARRMLDSHGVARSVGEALQVLDSD